MHRARYCIEEPKQPNIVDRKKYGFPTTSVELRSWLMSDSGQNGKPMASSSANATVGRSGQALHEGVWSFCADPDARDAGGNSRETTQQGCANAPLECGAGTSRSGLVESHVLGADKVNRRKGHNYITIFADLLGKRMLFRGRQGRYGLGSVCRRTGGSQYPMRLILQDLYNV